MGYPALFYNSVNNDRVYDADSFSDVFSAFFTSGVARRGGMLAVAPFDGRTISVGTGVANLNGKLRVFDTATTLEIDTPDASNARIDLVVVRRDDDARTIELDVVKGTPAQSPQAPGLTRSGAVYEICLARVRVSAAATVIAAGDITDTRNNRDVCGFITEAVEGVSPEALTALFNDWKETLTSTLDSGDAVSLGLLISGLTDRVNALDGGNISQATVAGMISAASGTLTDSFSARPYIVPLSFTRPTINNVVLPANKSYFKRQSVFRRSDVADFDAIAIVFRKCTDPVSGTYKLKKIGTNGVNTNENLSGGHCDYDAETVCIVRKGQKARVHYRDRAGRAYSRVVAWLTEDYSIICSGASSHVSARWGRPGTVNTASETAVATYDNAIYISDCQSGNMDASDLEACAASGRDMFVSNKNPFPASGSGSFSAGFHENTTNAGTIINNDQFLIPMAFYGIIFRASQAAVDAHEA